ncbi:MAG: FkbM family methyltransferase [Pseudomonadota bacterium]
MAPSGSTTDVAARLRRASGLARSLVIYHGNPLRRIQARRHYGAFVKPGDLCFDIGAHLGDRVRAFTHLGARVVALEPQPRIMTVLRRFYGRHPAVTLVEAAAGAKPGRASLQVSQGTPTLSTLSEDWRRQVSANRRFAGARWQERVEVQVTTLDALIAAHGRPDFCKIDVEGFEAEVLAGLSRPLPALSFEVIPAAPEQAAACLERLAQLGPYRFNISLGERKRLIFDDWRDRRDLEAWLAARGPNEPSGDVYARLGDGHTIP